MSLTSALAASRSALFAFGEQTGVLSRNISNATNNDATRKLAPLVTTHGGNVAVPNITRVVDTSLFNSNLDLLGKLAGSDALAEATARLDAIFSDPELGRSPAALIGKLRDALGTFSQQPDNTVLASTVVSSALSLTGALNYASSEVQAVRSTADREIADAVEGINASLAKIHELTASIVEGTRVGRDVTDLMDQRDVQLKSIATQMDISWSLREGNDIQIYTGSGVTLYDRVPRDVSFEPTTFFYASTSGNAIYADGVQISGSSSPMPLSSGRLAGLVEVRDTLAPTLQRQLDETARGLIFAFAEADQSAVPSLPDQAGLLTWSGGPGLPPAGTVLNGLAASIAVNPNVANADSAAAVLLRDGSISDPGNPAYTYNTAGFASYSDRLLEMVDAVQGSLTFDAATGLSTNSDIVGYAADMASWLGAKRAGASRDSDYLGILQAQTAETLSNATGVNLDEELSRMLQLERSYQASAKMISVVDELLGYLIEATR